MKLYLVRGLPGSGKSTRASHLGVEVCEADQYFAARNLHGVPLETIRRMRERWEDHG